MDDRLPPSPVRGPAENRPALDIRQLVADHHAALFRYAYRLSGAVQDAEDLTQQTFLIAHGKLDQIRSADCARSWLHAVLRNAFLRQRRRRPPLLAADCDWDLDCLPDDSHCEAEWDREKLDAALRALPEEFRTVLLMFYFEEMSYREIAAALELPLGTVMSRLSRAKGHLRFRLFEPECQVASTAPGEIRSRRPADRGRQEHG